MTTSEKPLDMIVIGAGFSGLYMLYQARVSGLRVRCIEAGDDVGGTWYWNRYPGARVDIESMEYSYSFSEELQQQWDWSERYAAQPELLAYAQHVAERFSLRDDIQFSTRVQAAHFDEARGIWAVHTSRGDTLEAQFCVFATGLISEPHKPEFEGLDSFSGKTYLTARWPQEGADFTGQRVGVIGTGSSGIQVIPEIARQAAHLTVFQRTPAFTVPLRNCPSTAEHRREIKTHYRKIRENQLNSFGGFTALHSRSTPAPTESAMAVPAEDRRARYEDFWQSGGLCFYNTYTDILLDESANETLSEFLRNKMRQRVRDPQIAEKLVPQDYPVLTRRLSADTDYCETFDRSNVSLIDVREDPIVRFETSGLRLQSGPVELDAMVFATGFDIQTGAMDKVDIRGRGGRSLKSDWSEGLSSYLGMMTRGFPNLIWLNGPGSPFFNPLLQAEFQGQWLDQLIRHMKQNRLQCVEPHLQDEKDWVQLTDAIGNATLFPKSRNYYMGDNVPGKPRRVLFFFGGFPAYREACEEAARDYSAFEFMDEEQA